MPCVPNSALEGIFKCNDMLCLSRNDLAFRYESADLSSDIAMFCLLVSWVYVVIASVGVILLIIAMMILYIRNR